MKNKKNKTKAASAPKGCNALSGTYCGCMVLNMENDEATPQYLKPVEGRGGWGKSGESWCKNMTWEGHTYWPVYCNNDCPPEATGPKESREVLSEVGGCGCGSTKPHRLQHEDYMDNLYKRMFAG